MVTFRTADFELGDRTGLGLRLLDPRSSVQVSSYTEWSQWAVDDLSRWEFITGNGGPLPPTAPHRRDRIACITSFTQ
ncbi:MAG: hypothetical protein ACRDRA_09150 [Pseudonocardiaceae bacterium]